jgi:BirA family transcriptional regulator, biotin operon repressor / biotin---[acetyl-CoA-carboxylase] ligase
MFAAMRRGPDCERACMMLFEQENCFDIEWLEEVDSTNSELKRRLKAGIELASGMILATSRQTAGRGRSGREWSSGAGDNLAFSVFLKLVSSPIELPALGMACALAVDDMLRERGIESQPKWPNDVRVRGRKICGILSENMPGGSVVLGIGINVNMDRRTADRVGQPATSMLIETDSATPPRKVIADTLPYLRKRCRAWSASGFESLRADWCRRVEGLHKMVTVRDGRRQICGLLEGFGRHGECLLKTDDGTKAIWSGDIGPHFE